MTIYLLDLYVIAAVCSVLAVLCGGAGLVCWITGAIDERHTRRCQILIVKSSESSEDAVGFPRRFAKFMRAIYGGGRKP